MASFFIPKIDSIEVKGTATLYSWKDILLSMIFGGIHKKSVMDWTKMHYFIKFGPNDFVIDQVDIRTFVESFRIEDEFVIKKFVPMGYTFNLMTRIGYMSCLANSPSNHWNFLGLIFKRVECEFYSSIHCDSKYTVLGGVLPISYHKKGIEINAIGKVKDEDGKDLARFKNIFFKPMEHKCKVITTITTHKDLDKTDLVHKETWKLEPLMAKNFLEPSGDPNPIHYFSKFAKLLAGFPSVVLQGTWILSKCMLFFDPLILHEQKINNNNFRLKANLIRPFILPTLAEYRVYQRTDQLCSFNFEILVGKRKKLGCIGSLTMYQC